MKLIKTLSIDLETYSSFNLKKCGVYKYAEAADAEILLFAYSINNEPVQVIDVANGKGIPENILNALTDNAIIKWAFNAIFERIFLSIWLKRNYPAYFKPYPKNKAYLDPSSWRCSMIWSAYLGLPLSLASVGSVLGLEDQKLKEGKSLIRYFCVPCKATKANGGRTRNLPSHAPDKWALFKKYNSRDVEVEQSIQKRLSYFPVPDFIWKEYHLDQEINDRGILLDMDFVEQAILLNDKNHAALISKLKEKTNLENPNSVAQMKEWLLEKGVATASLDKQAVANLLPNVSKEVADVLNLRKQLAKSSIKKYQAMKNAVCTDGRARGMFQFYGANRSGRWAGRIIQLQNLPQNHLPDLDLARELVKNGDAELLELFYNNLPEVLSELIRTAFIPKDEFKFSVADFSAIEARVLSYLADERWRIKVFADNEDIYCASASEMFGVPVEKHGINADLRQKGKISELALGYGGSVGALKAMGALDMGIEEDDLQTLVDTWRNSNPNIVQFWWDVDHAIKSTIKTRLHSETHGLKFTYEHGILFITLPSRRKLSYIKPRIGENRFGGESITYEGVGTNKKWERIESYGAKFVENIVQAISRDILCFAINTLQDYRICGHVHDEVIIECKKNIDLSTICNQMAITPDWINGLLLRADGYDTSFYKKD